MIFYSTKNVWEQHSYDYSLQDVATPQLFRDIFDYDHIPKVTFNYRSVPQNCPDKIYITDTTFRDGQQAMKPFTVQQIVDMYKLMHRLGGPNGVIRASEFFLYSEKDREAVRRCQELGYEFPEITSWIRANENDFQLVKEMGLKETGILVSCSDYHIFNKLHLTRAKAVEKYLNIIRKALEQGIVPRCHFEDITRADYYGFVLPFAKALQDLSDESGIPIKIRACDTMGYGVNYNGAALPRSVQGIIYGFHHYVGIPSDRLEWHGHNDFYKVVSNASTAWLYGCGSVNCSLLGIGERTGNCPLEAMVVEYCSIKGTDNGMDLPVITEIAEYFENELGYQIPANTPFVGKNFNTTRAGIHADGMMKDEEIYNIFNTAKILNRPPLVSIDSHTGTAGVTYWINNYYRLPEEKKVSKKSTIVLNMKRWIDSLYEAGRNTIMTDHELDEKLQELDPKRWNDYVKYRR